MGKAGRGRSRWFDLAKPPEPPILPFHSSAGHQQRNIYNSSGRNLGTMVPHPCPLQESEREIVLQQTGSKRKRATHTLMLFAAVVCCALSKLRGALPRIDSRRFSTAAAASFGHHAGSIFPFSLVSFSSRDLHEKELRMKETRGSSGTYVSRHARPRTFTANATKEKCRLSQKRRNSRKSILNQD